MLCHFSAVISSSPELGMLKQTNYPAQDHRHFKPKIDVRITLGLPFVHGSFHF